MLSHDEHRDLSRRSRAATAMRCLALTVVLLSPTLAACGGEGFRPMYASNAATGAIDASLRHVGIGTIPGRVGQQLRNELLFQSTGGSEPAEHHYQLSVVMRQRLTSALVSNDGNSGAQIYHMDANFQLSDKRTKKVVFEGQSFGRSSFQRFQTIYANVRAKRDAENRTAKTVAKDIAGRVRAFLSR